MAASQIREQWVIETEGLGRRFGEREVLADIGLRIGQAEIFGVLGADGAGKTTLMQILAAILDPTAGRCRVLGFDTVRQSAAVTSRIGYMSQGFTLYDRLSVEENLAFAATVRGVRGETYRRRRERLLAMAGLGPFVERRAGDLSGGMRKKLSLCTNLIHEPPLLLLDEMSLGVDPLSRRELWDMLREFRAGGATIVLSTPYMDEAGHCDRLAFLEHGRILAADAPATLRARAEGKIYRLEARDADAAWRLLAYRPELAGMQWSGARARLQFKAAALAPELSQALGRVGDLHPAVPSLEDVFVLLSAARPEPSARLPAWSPREGDAAASNEAVRARGVTCRFGTFTAVDDVSLSVSRGEVFGFLGPNGAGKTTLIRALCGLIRPASGELRVAGIDVVRDPARLRRHIGYMSQRFSLYADLTARENLAFFAGIYGLRGRARSAAVAWASDMTGLSGLGDRLVAELSGAERQRLALASSILHRPAVLFLDEPTSGVDPHARRRFWQLIQALAQGGMTVFVTTHYLEEATYCQRLGLMFAGRLIALGSIGELRAALSAPAETMEDIFLAYIERARRTRVAA